MFNIVAAVVVVVMAVGNVLFNCFRLVKNRSNTEIRDSCIGNIRIFGYLGLGNIVIFAFLRYIHGYFGVAWPLVVSTIISLLLAMVIVLGMIIEYEDIKYAPM